MWMKLRFFKKLVGAAYMQVRSIDRKLRYFQLFFMLQKITGRELKYTALIGKPSEITYHHADYLLHQQAIRLGIDGIQTIYCIGYVDFAWGKCMDFAWGECMNVMLLGHSLTSYRICW